MTTAASPRPADDAADRFTTSVRALKAAQRIPTADLCGALHMSRTTFFARLNDGAWSFADVVTLSDVFGVPVQTMIDGIGRKSTDP